MSIEHLFKTNDVNKISIFCFTTGKKIEFPAFVTDFSDSFKLDFSNTQVYGRMDPITTYKNTSRIVNISFDIPNASLTDSQTSMAYIDTLIQSLYPIYSSESNNGKGTYIISSPPMFRIKFANLISNANVTKDFNAQSLQSGLLGFIPSFDFKPKIDSGFFKTEDMLYPKLINVNLTLNVLHEHPLGNVINENGELTTRIKNDDSATGINSFPHKFSSTNQIKTGIYRERNQINDTTNVQQETNKEAATKKVLGQ